MTQTEMAKDKNTPKQPEEKKGVEVDETVKMTALSAEIRTTNNSKKLHMLALLGLGTPRNRGWGSGCPLISNKEKLFFFFAIEALKGAF